MVMIESLACGTPVVATPCGSVPELIDDGVTGFVRDSEDELAQALGQVQELDRNTCRKVASDRFSSSRHGRSTRRAVPLDRRVRRPGAQDSTGIGCGVAARVRAASLTQCRSTGRPGRLAAASVTPGTVRHGRLALCRRHPGGVPDPSRGNGDPRRGSDLRAVGPERRHAPPAAPRALRARRPDHLGVAAVRERRPGRAARRAPRRALCRHLREPGRRAGGSGRRRHPRVPPPAHRLGHAGADRHQELRPRADTGRGRARLRLGLRERVRGQGAPGRLARSVTGRAR